MTPRPARGEPTQASGEYFWQQWGSGKRGKRERARRLFEEIGSTDEKPHPQLLSLQTSPTPTAPPSRTKQELSHQGNEGLADVVEWLKPIAEAAAPKLSLADVFQLAAAVVVEGTGGPVLGFEPGRRDSWAYAPEGRLFDPRRAAREAAAAAGSSGGGAPNSAAAAAAGPSSVRRSGSGGGLPSSSSPPSALSSPVSCAQARALRAFAARLGMPLRHVVALAGAHTLGRWWPDAGAAGAGSSQSGAAPLPLIAAPPPGADGSPRFDNSYFSRLLEGSLPQDAFLLADAETRLLVEEYAASEATFFVDYAAAHDELSRLGMPRGAGGWHRQHRQEQQGQQGQGQQGQGLESRHHRSRSHHHKKGREGASSSSAAAGPRQPSPPGSAFDAARRSGGGGQRGAPPPPPSYWASWPAIDNLATALGVSPGTAAAASAVVVGTVAVVGGAALVWSRRRSRLLAGRRR